MPLAQPSQHCIPAGHDINDDELCWRPFMVLLRLRNRAEDGSICLWADVAVAGCREGASSVDGWRKAVLEQATYLQKSTWLEHHRR
jgi:hypothetical protein